MRGRPREIPTSIIVSVRAALARGEQVATIAKAHRLSRRYVRDILADVHRRPDAVEIPPEIAALESVEGEFAGHARDMHDLWCLLASGR